MIINEETRKCKMKYKSVAHKEKSSAEMSSNFFKAQLLWIVNRRQRKRARSCLAFNLYRYCFAQM